MMDCKSFRERLSEFLDRALPAPELSQAESHMSGCPGCRSEFEELKGVSKMIAGVGRKPLPAGFMQRLERRRRMAEEPAPAKDYYLLPHGFPRYVAFALSSLIVVFVIADKARFMMAPVQSQISGAASNLGESDSGAFAVAKAAGKGVASRSLGNLDKAAGGGESVNMNTVAMLQQASGSSDGKSLEFMRLKEEAKRQEMESAAEAKREMAKDDAAASFTSTGHKLAKARGNPIGEAPGGAGGGSAGMIAAAPAAAPPAEPEAKTYTSNDELIPQIEAQKKKMGIRKIVAPNPDEQRLRLLQAAAERASGGVNIPGASVSPAALSGQTPALLAPNSLRGSAMPDMQVMDKGGRRDEIPGVLIRSETERRDLWHKYQMTQSAPSVDYNTQMLAVVFATSPRTVVQISRVDLSPDQITVSFHEKALPADAPDTGAEPFSYSVRVIPRTDKPVAFQKVP